MASNRSITIVGGGPAGLSLGIALRQKNIEVRLYEAGDYPRHKVCGEFISGEGLHHLREWGLIDRLRNAGARDLTTISFLAEQSRLGPRALPAPALGVSRFSLDHLLAKKFAEDGGRLLVRTRWSDGTGSEGCIRAAGRSPGPRSAWRWFGLKAHAREVRLGADLEMHFRRDGYVGLCQLDDEWVNVCGLFRTRDPVPELSRAWPDFLRGPAGTLLSDRLEHAVLERKTFASVAGLGFSPQPMISPAECAVGDALGMIAPVTGNGLSLAFESAFLAADPLAAYCRGECAWSEAARKIARAQSRRFRRRFWWGFQLQSVAFCPVGRRLWLELARFCWRAIFRRTR